MSGRGVGNEVNLTVDNFFRGSYAVYESYTVVMWWWGSNQFQVKGRWETSLCLVSRSTGFKELISLSERFEL